MGKNKDKNKDEIANLNPSSVTNRDVLQRLNFLYQASVLLNSLAPPGSVPDNDPSGPVVASNDRDTATQEGDSPSRSKRKKRRRVVSFGELSRSYVETMKSVGQKTNVRMYVLVLVLVQR